MHLRLWLLFLLTAPVGGCGLFVPTMQDFYEKTPLTPDEMNFENVVINSVKCQIHLGVQKTLDYFQDDPGITWLKSWGATVNLKLSADEKSSLGPTVSVTPPGVFSLGASLTGSVDATRAETIEFTYAFQDLLQEPRIQDRCSQTDGILIRSDLKIDEFIFNKAFIATVPGTTLPKKPKASPYSVFSDDITFVASYSGDITPTWKFLRVTVDPTGMFASASRIKTDTLTITLGPATPATKGRPAQVSEGARNIHYSSILGHAVANAIQSQR
jgi:hypothetical protein